MGPRGQGLEVKGVAQVQEGKAHRKVQAFTRRFLKGYKGFVGFPDGNGCCSPWWYSSIVVDGILNGYDIKDVIQHKLYGVPEVFDLMSALSHVGQMTFKYVERVWDGLTPEERMELLNSVVTAAAEVGLEALLINVARRLEALKDQAVRRNIHEAVRLYLKGAKGFEELAHDIASGLWPGEGQTDEERQALEDFWKGIKLADYVPEEKVEGLVRRYLMKAVHVMNS
jgi:hypothetical protein